MMHRLLIALIIATGALVSACGAKESTDAAKSSGATSTAAQAPAAAAATGPIDACAIVTPDDAAKLLGPLPQQPPAKTDHAGFGISACMYVGPALSGQGAQTKFAQLWIQTGRGKDAADMLEYDGTRRQATIALPGVGDSARRNAAGSFVWATKGGIACTAEIRNGLPASVTADAAATGLGGLCQKVFAAAH
jgi:hypothetical protein